MAVALVRAGDPVRFLGFDHLPPADEFVRMVGQERQATHLANLRAERTRRKRLAQHPRCRVSLAVYENARGRATRRRLQQCSS